MQDKLSLYGFTFQTKLIACIMTDASFTSKIYDLIKLNYFENKSIQTIIKICLDYFIEYKTPPTLEVIKVKLELINDTTLKQEIISTLRESVHNASALDLDFIKEETLRFCKNQELRDAILDSVELLKLGKFDAIKERIDAAFKVGLDDNLGIHYEDNDAIDARYNEDIRQTIPTGWDVIDELLRGGMAPGDLGVILASSGVGKTWALIHIGAYAKKYNKRVVHYTLELSENYVAKRYDSVLTGISLDKTSLYVENIKETLAKLPGELLIKEYPMKSISLMGIRGHLTKLKMINQMPDIIMLDYADLLKFQNSSASKEESLALLYEELKGLAKEFKVPIWTVSQSGREGMKELILEADKLSGAFAKLFPADVMLSISRRPEDKLSNTARMHVIKNRHGADGLTFPMTMDTNRGYLKVHQANSEEGKSTTNRMSTPDDYQKQMLRKRYAELQETPKLQNLF